MTKPRLFHRNFTLVVLGQIISLLGNAIISFALPLHLLKLTGSGAIFGAVLAVSILPTIVLSPIGGVLADRINRKNIMVVLDFVTTGVILLAGLFLGRSAVAVICATLVLLSVIRSFYQPAVQASVPALTAPEHLLRANSVVNMVSAVSALVGPLLGGVLYGFFGITPILALGGAAFLLSAVMELFIRMPFVRQETGKKPFALLRSDFSEGIEFITKRQPIILKTIVIAALMNLFLSALLMIGTPYLVNITLGLSSELYGLAQSATGIGSLAGGILVSVLAAKLTRRTYPALLACTSICLLPFGVVLLLPLPTFTVYWVIVVFCMLAIMFSTMFSIVVITLVQQLTPPELTGKVMSLITTASICALPLGQAMYGVLFEKITDGIGYVYFATAAVLLVIVAAAKRTWRH